ncbi:zinc finger protein 227-like [Ruditapes philippinarum]|uniref:zinc finger protein 227-like n=1 Tax=Ruditapes philippinarum TaxID=129788 RepID=UPI00295C3882|nr:zinc finger protein 227-like [Ruditapes philippinarum]
MCTNGKKKDDRKQFTCEICEYDTGKKYNLERHIKVHVDTDESASKTTLMCDVCGMQFLSKFGMALHTKNEHLKQFKYECQICKKGFNQLLPYKGHVSSHVKHTKQKCEKCNLTFKHKSSLDRHKKTIHDDVKYDCAECEQHH